MSSPIINYTTTVAVDKTLAEITRILSSRQSVSVMTDYENGVLSTISFRLTTRHGLMSFMLPARVDKVYAILCKSHIARRLRTKEQAARVAWRIIKDWIEAQFALIQTEQATIEEVFLPYMQNQNGQTLFASLAESGFKGLALPAPKESE